MNRRQLLQALAALAATAGPGVAAARRIPWRNWSGYQRCEPEVRIAPPSKTALADVLRESPAPVRPVGAGHSFSALVPTPGTIVSLRHFDGLIDHDPERMTATLGAGTKLGRIGELLAPIGQALPNMPDVDEQSLAGAMATGTHGTGAALGALHSQIDALELVTPTGDILKLSRTSDADAFAAAQVSLGALGVISAYTLRNVPTYTLRRRTELEALDAVLSELPDRLQAHRGFEMFYIPFSGQALTITTDESSGAANPRVEDIDNAALEDLRLLRDLTGWSPTLRRQLFKLIAAVTFDPEDNTDIWHRIYPSERAVRFNEMEYHLPLATLPTAVDEVRRALEAEHPEVFFPLEVRATAADQAWLSPFHDRASGSIAVHRVHDEDPWPVFRTVEPILRRHGGRPHWGKMHSLRARELAELYPRWQDFLRVRRELDPDGRMLNAHLRTLLIDA